MNTFNFLPKQLKVIFLCNMSHVLQLAMPAGETI